VVSPRVRDAERGRADRRVARVRERRWLVMRYPVAVLRLHARKLALQHRNAATGRVQVRRDAQRADAEGARLPGRTHRHAEGDEEVLARVLRGSGSGSRSRSDRVLDD